MDQQLALGFDRDLAHRIDPTSAPGKVVQLVMKVVAEQTLRSPCCPGLEGVGASTAVGMPSIPSGLALVFLPEVPLKSCHPCGLFFWAVLGMVEHRASHMLGC